MRSLSLILFFWSFSGLCQDTISAPSDSIKPHSVRRAVIYSACLPGLGQVYNHIAMPKGKKKAYWKVPLIYAGLTASGYYLVSNNITKNELKTEYELRSNNQIGDIKWSAYDDQGVLTLYDQYLNWRDLSILAISAVYVLQVVDAGVEAHFVNFDVSEDLSLGIDPTFVGNYNPGIRLSLNFR